MSRRTTPLALAGLVVGFLFVAAGTATALPPPCDTSCTCQSSCSSLCSIGGFVTTCGDEGICVDWCGCSGTHYIYGTSNSDTLYGTSCNDVIYGYAGHDTIYALGGNDTCNGGSGDDTINCGSGTDYANGGSGYDVCYSCETVVSCP